MKFDYKQIIDEIRSKNFWPRILIMIGSVLILSLNYNIFLLQNDLVIGGTSGIATIVHSHININPGTFILICNIILLIISFIALGRKQTGMTIVGSLLFPIFISLTTGISETIVNHIQIEEFILIAIISGILDGIGNGFIYKTGYSTGGTDIIMQIIDKYGNIPRGTASFIVNFIVVALGALTFGLNKALYAIIIIAINSVLVDRIMLGISSSKVFYIQTDKKEEVERFLKKEMHTGYTIIHTDRGNKDGDKNLIMCVLSTRDYYMVKNVIQTIDPNAFLIISDCYEVYGGQRKPQFPFI